MTRFVALFMIMLSGPAVVFAEQTVPPEHSTVHIVFIIPNIDPAKFEATTQTARVGNVVAPIDSIRPISVKIDDEFVGHALVGYENVTPVFVLKSGTRKFSFSCDGFKTVTSELKVLGTGSKQYLIVKFLVDSKANDKQSVSDAGATGTVEIKR